MAIGGLEYTEGIPTTMWYRPAHIPVDQHGTAVPNILPLRVMEVGGTTINIFQVPAANAGTWLAAVQEVDHEVLRYSHVALTNDIRSAEWKIETHRLDGRNTAELMMNIEQDLKLMFAMRAELAGAVRAAMAQFPGDTIVLATGGTTDLAGAAGTFEYRPGERAEGKAQITVQYSNKETIRRLCLLNASKYLTGDKIAEGQDVAYAVGAPGLAQGFLGLVGISSFSTAEKLLKTLTATAAPIADATNTTVLTREDVGLLKLMIINDAMATTMTRYHGTKGEAQEKNIQRFFPKSRRQRYVDALAGRDVGLPALAALRAQLSAVGVAAAMAQEEWDNVDPFALRVDETLLAATAVDAQRITNARRLSQEGQKVDPADQTFIKDQVLGANGGLLATWIQRATLAYTDPSGDLRIDHEQGGVGNVVSADRYTPVATQSNGTVIHGAVYEFREREVKMRENDYSEAVQVMAALLEAS